MKKGLYRHYKGNTYEVMGTALHSETEETMIIYKALYESEFGKEALWVRPINMFKENVTVDGKEIPRFAYIQDNQEN